MCLHSLYNDANINDKLDAVNLKKTMQFPVIIWYRTYLTILFSYIIAKLSKTQ